MNSNELIDFLSMTTVLLLTTTVGFAIAWVRARERVLRERADRAERSDGRELETARTERLEQAIDAIATEVERLGESQRFTARLLSEREKERADLGAARPSAERAITPH